MIIKPEYMKAAGEQISQLKAGDAEYWDNLSKFEYNAMKPYIGHPYRVLDLGCGLGRMSVYLNSKLQDPDVEYILADSTGELKVKAGWKAKPGFYNDLALTEKFVVENGIKKYRLFDIKKYNVSYLKDIDLIMSFLSVGFHYPIEGYYDDLLKALSTGGTMVFGVRRGKYCGCKFDSHFTETHLIEGTIESSKCGKTKEDILILKGKV